MPEPRVAIVTGASMGIGAEFAFALAKRGYDLLLVARTASALESVAERARACGVRADVLVADLADPAAVDVVSAAAGRMGGQVELLVNNAGFGLNGNFETQDEARIAGMVRLNVESLVSLTRRFLPGMLAAGGGSVINVASTAAFQPLPWMAVYGATKAFVLSFSEAIAEEYRGRGVRCVALCPGATETAFFTISGDAAAVGTKRTPQQVVATALRALDAGKVVAIDGSANAALALSPRFLPRWLMRRLAGRAMHGA